ncbi:hypothetical protein OROGR_027845 [Orobanche gracilis]
MSRRDPAWRYATEINVPDEGAKKEYKYLKCNFCGKEIKGGVKRVKEHLACTRKNVTACPKVPAEVKEEIKMHMKSFEQSNHAAQRNFQEIVNSGSHYLTSSHMETIGSSVSDIGVRGPMDRFLVDDLDNISPANTKDHKNAVDDEYDMRNRSLINFLVNQYGTVFLKTVDASDLIKDANQIFEMFDEIVEEVGEEHVIQVVTDNASAYKAAGRMLMEKRPHLYWTPCAAHCIDLMLEKIGELPQHRNALRKTKKVTNFIYNHRWVLSLARKYVEKDLVRAAATRFATAFLTLDIMLEVKEGLQRMFVSNKWMGCAWAKKDEGKAVKDIVMDERVFWPSLIYAINTTKPLVQVLRLADGATPAMGFIYGAMDEAKVKIAANLDNEEGSYKQIWEIIDLKWENQMHRDLHACAYYLNPRYRWKSNFSLDVEVKRGLLNCMEKLLSRDAFTQVDKQLDTYTHKRGLFGHRASLESYNTRSPVDSDELRQQQEEEMDDYCSQVPVRHLVFMVHGIGQRLEKSSLVDDVGNLRHVTASLAERHLTSHQRGTQRVLYIPCQWRKGLRLSGEAAVDKITLDGVRGLRTMLSATVHDVLYYMSPIYCQDIIDSS